MFRIIIFLGGTYLGWRLGRKIAKWLSKKSEKKKWNKIRNNLLSMSIRIHDKYTNVKKVAQVSFERFLTLYEVSPEKWIIEDDPYGYDKYFPVYVQGSNDVEIPLFWETWEDLQKYNEWVQEKFTKGDAALYQQARDESMKLLTKFIKEDLERKRKRAEEEIAELEAQVKKECEQAKEKQKKIQLTLESSQSQTWSNTSEEATEKIGILETNSFNHSSNSYTQFYPYTTYFQVQNVGTKESIRQEIMRLQTNISQSMQSQMIQQQLNNVAVMPTGWRY